MSKSGNLLELVMIVKNSGDEIIPMLNAIKNYIDHWTILDTGSTDNTMDNIRNTLKDVPGNLYDATKLYRHLGKSVEADFLKDFIDSSVDNEIREGI